LHRRSKRGTQAVSEYRYRFPPITKLSWRVSRGIIIISPRRVANEIAFEFSLVICNNIRYVLWPLFFSPVTINARLPARENRYQQLNSFSRQSNANANVRPSSLNYSANYLDILVYFTDVYFTSIIHETRRSIDSQTSCSIPPSFADFCRNTLYFSFICYGARPICSFLSFSSAATADCAQPSMWELTLLRRRRGAQIEARSRLAFLPSALLIFRAVNSDQVVCIIRRCLVETVALLPS